MTILAASPPGGSLPFGAPRASLTIYARLPPSDRALAYLGIRIRRDGADWAVDGVNDWVSSKVNAAAEKGSVADEEAYMGIGDKISNKAEEVGGKAKEAVGDATDNESLEAEGKVDQSSAHGKQAGENVKDALREASTAVKGDDGR